MDKLERGKILKTIVLGGVSYIHGFYLQNSIQFSWWSFNKDSFLVLAEKGEAYSLWNKLRDFYLTKLHSPGRKSLPKAYNGKNIPSIPVPFRFPIPPKRGKDKVKRSLNIQEGLFPGAPQDSRVHGSSSLLHVRVLYTFDPQLVD